MSHPTQEPVSERILQSIEHALHGIRADRADKQFWNTVHPEYVLRFDAGIPQIPGYPACIATVIDNDVDDDLESDIHSLNEETMRVLVEGWIDKRSDVEKELLRFARDIRTALMEDPRRDELAIHTHIQSMRFIHAADVTEPYSVVEIEFDVVYRTVVEDLETAG